MSSSRPYKVTIKESYKGLAVADDSLSTTLEIPPVLAPGRQADVLRGVLQKRGFEPTDDGGMSRERDGVRIDINPDDGGVTVSASGSVDLDLQEEADSPSGGCGCVERAKAAVREGLRKKLDRAVDEAAAVLQADVTARLEQAAPKAACELERIAAHVTQEALKEKAAQLGEVTSITHDKGGDMTITVKV